MNGHRTLGESFHNFTTRGPGLLGYKLQVINPSIAVQSSCRISLT